MFVVVCNKCIIVHLVVWGEHLGNRSLHKFSQLLNSMGLHCVAKGLINGWVTLGDAGVDMRVVSVCV